MIGKVLITGIYSRLGLRLREDFLKRNWTVIGFSRKPRDINALFADLTEKSQILNIFEREHPDCVIHTAAITDVDLCEKDKSNAYKINVIGTKHVAEACQSIGARLIYISTDYVFDGKDGPYSENAPPAPINHYGLSKWEGEKNVQSICENALIVRTCVPYDWNPNAAPNFLMWLIEKLKAKAKIKIVNDQYNTPAFIPHLAECIADLCKTEHWGIVHLSGMEFISRYDFALKICNVFGFSPASIEPCSSTEIKQVAPRPLKGGLIVEKAEKILGKKMLTVEEGLRRAYKCYVSI